MHTAKTPRRQKAYSTEIMNRNSGTRLQCGGSAGRIRTRNAADFFRLFDTFGKLRAILFAIIIPVKDVILDLDQVQFRHGDLSVERGDPTVESFSLVPEAVEETIAVLGGDKSTATSITCHFVCFFW